MRVPLPRARRARSWLATLGVPVLLAPASASAENASPWAAHLSWTAPVGCPGEEEVRARLARLVPLDAPMPEWEVSAVVTREPDERFALRLTFESAGRSRQRAMSADSCTELADAAAVILALGVDPAARSSAWATQDLAMLPSSPEAAQRSPPDVAPDHATDQPIHNAAPRGPSGGRPNLRVSLLGGASAGVLASPSFGLGAAVAWASGRLRIELAGTWFPSAHVEVATENVGGDFSLISAGGSVCGSVLVPGTLFLGPCAGGEAGRLGARGTGVGVGQPLDASAVWGAVKAGGLLVWYAAPRIGLRVGIDGILPLTRDHFFVPGAGAEDVHRAAPVGGQMFAGVETTFF
jgi:hypothetical protein